MNLADTWAHQDFAGEGNQAINAIGRKDTVTAKGKNGKFQKTVWTGVPWALRNNTDCAAGPDAALGGDLVSTGHAQIGYYPDYSCLTYKYSPAWLPKGARFLVRNNPKEYIEAWSWLSHVMGVCLRKTTEDDLPAASPREIEAAISKWRKLSTKESRAFKDSEQCWKNASPGKIVHDAMYTAEQWPKLDGAALGLFDGVALTRYGTSNVKKDSTLHYMETASSVHYQFCVNWLAANPKYSWVPSMPKS
jgi:hypothetical protein